MCEDIGTGPWKYGYYKLWAMSAAKEQNLDVPPEADSRQRFHKMEQPNIYEGLPRGISLEVADLWAVIFAATVTQIWLDLTGSSHSNLSSSTQAIQIFYYRHLIEWMCVESRLQVKITGFPNLVHGGELE